MPQPASAEEGIYELNIERWIPATSNISTESTLRFEPLAIISGIRGGNANPLAGTIGILG